MGSYKSKPKRRFVGFDNDWERRKFGDVGSVSMCKRIFKDETTDDGDIPFFKIGTFGGEPDAYISRNHFENYKAKYPYPNKGDILLSASGTIGRMVEYNGEEAYFQDSNIVWLSHDQSIDNSFLKVLYGIVKWDGIEGSTIQRLYNDNFLKTKYQMPSKEEQEKIGGYFANLDNLIALHQRKYEKLQSLKKAYLSEMFPLPGEKRPRRRFAGFTGDWEQCKLIDGCEYVDYRGKTPSKTENGVFLVTAKNVKAGYIDYEASQEYIAKEDYDEVMHRGMPKIGDVLITTEAPCGNVAQVDREDIALAQRVIKYRGHENQIDNTYLKHYLLTPHFQGVLESKSSGGTVQGIKGSILHQQIIRHPGFEEQVKIGRYLDSVDNLIALHQRKLAKLQALKKAYLTEMFP